MLVHFVDMGGIVDHHCLILMILSFHNFDEFSIIKFLHGNYPKKVMKMRWWWFMVFIATFNNNCNGCRLYKHPVIYVPIYYQLLRKEVWDNGA